MKTQRASNENDRVRIEEWLDSQVFEEIAHRFHLCGIGMGRKETGGRTTDFLSIRFYVDKKADSHARAIGDEIPRYIESRSPSGSVTLPTDVIELPPAEPQADPRGVLRPVPGGANIGAGGASGTLGGTVIDETDRTTVMLSVEHLFGSIPGTPIIQPSLRHGGTSSHRIGAVKRAVSMAASGGTVDAAIGAPDSPNLVSDEVLDIVPRVNFVGRATEQMRVQKFGQATRFTRGVIVDTRLTRSYRDGVMRDAILISGEEDWSSDGDSGAFVLTDGDSPVLVGLHFAGGYGWGYACKAENVFPALRILTVCLQGTSNMISGVLRFNDGLGEGPFASALQANAELLGRSRQRLARIKRQGRSAEPAQSVVAQRVRWMEHLLADSEARSRCLRALSPLAAGAPDPIAVLTRPIGAEGLHHLRRLAAADPLAGEFLGSLDSWTPEHSLGSILGLEDELRFGRRGRPAQGEAGASESAPALSR